jgi:hypothetical protein
MTLIQLHNPAASSHRLERVHMFPGRFLSEEEFDRNQDYADARLAPLLQGSYPGVVRGLELNLNPHGLISTGFSVNPGIAVDSDGLALGLYYPLQMEWQTLIENYQTQSGINNASGVYYLTLHRATRSVDALDVEPCQRAEFDPSRDSQLVVVGSLKLHRLAIDPGAVTTTTQGEIENWVAADRVDGQFMQQLKNAVPLALIAIRSEGSGFAIHWVSQAAGRYPALANSGYHVLLNQVNATLRRVMLAAQDPLNSTTPLEDFLNANLNLSYLPAAGQLPLEWLQNPASITPSLLWLPNHLGIDIVPAPEEAVDELIQRHLPRRVIDLRQPAGDKIRLLLAVNEPDYRTDLLDIPPTDAQLESDIYRFFMRAYKAWFKWRTQFDVLYYHGESTVLDAEQIRMLDLPKPEPLPPLPEMVFNALVARAEDELQDPANPGIPYPYNKNTPPRPDFYMSWLVDSDGVRVPPPIPTPDQDGVVIRYAIGLVELEMIENQIRAMRSRLEKSRDYLLLQRQQLDSQTVALASLAGGVAGDGSGLQVARWLPFANLKPEWAKKPEPVVEASSTAASSTGFHFALMEPVNLSALVNAGTFSRSLLDTSSATSSKVSSMIRNRPATASAFELNINQSRMNLLANLPKKALTRPAFEAKEYRFGVLDHINPEVNEYSKAYHAMAELIITLDSLFDKTDAAALKAKLRKAGKLKTPQEVENLPPTTGDDETDQLNLTQSRYAALFEAGQILTRQIAIVEARYNSIERKLQRKLRDHINKQAEIKKLSALIQAARETLEARDSLRIEQLGDYGVSQRLLDEDWLDVYKKNLGRTRILTTAVRGLYYVRVRQAPVSAPLADPLELRYGSSRDIVPGCDWSEDVDVAEELSSFFDAVTEIPMSDWSALKDLLPKLPPFTHYPYLEQMRRFRFQARPVKTPIPGNTSVLQSRLKTLHYQNRVVMQQWAKVSLPTYTASSIKTQTEATRILSLEDLSSSSAGHLRKDAQALREKLEQCQYCLLENLNQLPPSLRLQWGQLAEDDRIRVEDVSWWPALDRAERDDFNVTRTVAELIAWWFRQLDSDASANSRSAMRNMIRATLIHASLGDPQEIVRGSVYVPPRISKLGERLHVKLNRIPAPGAQLQLLDNQQQVIAMLAVEDHTPQGTQVKIVQLANASIQIKTGFQVLANKRSRKLLS